jgi:hypothetical protein
LTGEDGGRRFIDRVTQRKVGKATIIYLPGAPELPLEKMLESMPQYNCQKVASGEKLN